MAQDPSTRLANKGALLAIGSAVALSTMGIFAKLTFETGTSPLEVVSWRATIAAVLVATYIVFFKSERLKIDVSDVFTFLILGIVGISLNYLLFFKTLEVANVSTAISLLYTYPIMVTVTGCLFLGEKFTNAKLLCVFLAFCGVLFVAQADSHTNFVTNSQAIMFGLGAAITKVVYTLISKKLLEKYDPRTIIFYALTFGAIFLLIPLGPNILTFHQIPLNGWVWITAIAVIPTLIGYSLFVAAMKFIEASRASIIALLEPVIATFLAFLILNELPSLSQLFGGLLVFASIAVLHLQGD